MIIRKTDHFYYIIFDYLFKKHENFCLVNGNFHDRKIFCCSGSLYGILIFERNGVLQMKLISISESTFVQHSRTSAWSSFSLNEEKSHLWMFVRCNKTVLFYCDRSNKLSDTLYLVRSIIADSSLKFHAAW